MPDNQRLNIRLSPEEKALWSRCASQHGLSISDWIRTTLNNHAAAIQRKRLHDEVFGRGERDRHLLDDLTKRFNQEGSEPCPPPQSNGPNTSGTP